MPRRTLKTTVTTATAKALERKRKDDAYLLRTWREWRSAEVREALAGPDRVAVRRLLDACRRAVTWSDLKPAELLAPFADADPGTAAVARGVVAAYWGSMREAVGLAPFDDEIGF